MKRILFLIGLAFFTKICVSQNNSYYWYHGVQYYLNERSDKYYILVKDIDTTQIKYYLQSKSYEFDCFQEFTNIWSADLSGVNYYWTFVRCSNFDTAGFGKMLEYFSPEFSETISGSSANISNLFHVKLRSPSDTVALKQMANSNGVLIMGRNKYMPLWYTLYCNKNSTLRSLAMANYFYETGIYSAVEPDFMGDNDLNCVSDLYFSDQWGLKNTGQYGGLSGIDIKYCDVQSITNGNSNVIVAILDQGIEREHPDLTNIYSISYDSERDVNHDQSWGHHGTACAGIIGAEANNGIGVAGIAPQCPLMSISNKLSHSVGSVEKRANGINFAWKNGASVISNSWKSDVSEMLEEAIDSAITFGRNGKGTVVVFSSGNNNTSSVIYPACLNSVISVGAISPCGERKSEESCDQDDSWGSNYGSRLDIMAPGVLISTTDALYESGYNNLDPISNPIVTQDYSDIAYTRLFCGTSAAAPHVAAVAALMLSVNPNLTQQQVRDILERTAQKVRTDKYYYKDTIGRPNGKWNNQMGYGLLDAYEAVRNSLYDLYTKDYVADDGLEPSDINHYLYNSPDIWVRNNKDAGITNQYAVVNDTNYVYVRVHNRGFVASSNDSVQLYTKHYVINPHIPNLDFSFWRNYWRKIATAPIPSIPAGDSIIICIPVYFDGLMNRHMILSRIVSAIDTMHTQETTSTDFNVRYNNNISIKNLTAARFYTTNYTHGLYVPQIMAVSSELSSNPFRLQIGIIGEESGANILDEAEVTLILGENLASYWQNNNVLPSGLKQMSDNTYLVENENVLLDNFAVPEGYEADLSMKYNFLTRKDSPNNTYSNTLLKYIILDDTEYELVGGLTIQIEKPERAATDMFIANAGYDTAVLLNTTATLHATQINENATYRWYDKQRNFQYEGVNYSVVPSQTSEYILEVTAESDGYRDLDTVKVNVVPGCIRSISPNPVEGNWITVSYEYTTTVTSAHLYIYNTGTTTLVGNYDLTNLGNVSSLDIEVTNYPTGSYTVVLVCDNAVCHSKVLIRQ